MAKINVRFSEREYELVKSLLDDHYEMVSQRHYDNRYHEKDDISTAYRAIMSLRRPLAEKSWVKYLEDNPDPEWRTYLTRKEYLEQAWYIYPGDDSDD